jgi:hypothetical protein
MLCNYCGFWGCFGQIWAVYGPKSQKNSLDFCNFAWFGGLPGLAVCLVWWLARSGS